jgi:hypothetical protein
MMKMSSGVLPELEMATTTSSALMTPRSPWAASVACTKNEEMPSDENEALIFCAMMPDLPTPVKMTRPDPRLSMSSTTRSKSRPIVASRFCRAWISFWMTSLAIREGAITSLLGNGG